MTYIFRQKVLFKHCDPAGIVFYPRYFEMINDAIEMFFADVVGMPFEEMHEVGAVPTVRIDITFDAVSRHGDALEIAVVPTRLGGASLDLTVTATSGGQTRFAARMTLVHVGSDMRAERWPEAARHVLGARIEDGPASVTPDETTD